MVRKGISLSLTYVVVGLILLSTAVSVLIYFQGGIDKVQRVVGGETVESGDELARNNCEVEMRSLCRQDDIDGTQWAEEGKGGGTAFYNEEPCSAYWEGNPPECP